ncbi:hypothetical protein SNEBB_009692 [Seison nebaliae]|nr:hypothetical protein SNEBB_009692 [Seison nebaliae]
MDEKTAIKETQENIIKIRILLTSSNVKALETMCRDLISATKANNAKVIGPIRLPNKILRITTRKTPCGEGSKTWDRYQLRIHKRCLHVESHQEAFRKIISINLDASVNVKITSTGAQGR